MATKRKKAGGPPPERVARKKADPKQFRGDSDQPVAQEAYKWWAESDSRNASSKLWSWVDKHRSWWSQASIMDLVYEAAYRGQPVGAMTRATGGQYLLMRSGILINLNVIMSNVDTLTARMTKRRPMPVINADDATYSEKLFATETSRVLRRKVGGKDVDKDWPLVIRDTLIRGDGCYKVFPRNGDVGVKRTPIYEWIVDPFEAEHGGPLQMVHNRPVPRDTMRAMFPKYAKEIDAAPVYNRNDPWAVYAYQTARTHDYIEVCEGWHLRSDDDASDGQHIISIKGNGSPVICREEWEAPRFPLARFSWSPPTRAWRGLGLVEQLWGIQEQINDILRDAREGLKHGSQLTIFAQRGANVNKNHLRARHPKIVEFDGATPQFVAPNPVSEQAIRILMMLISQAKEMAGNNDQSTSGQNPLGASASGKALETMDDLQDNRFSHVVSNIQNGRVELGHIIVDQARALYCAAHPDEDDDEDAKREPFEEQPDKTDEDDLAPWIKNTDWSEMDIDGGTYHLVLEPANFIADSRAGRFSDIAELGKNGLIPDPAMQADLFQEPDIQRANRTILGPKHRLDRVMEGLANPEVDLLSIQPDQYMNLDLGILMANGELNEAESHRRPGVEDETLDLVCDRYRQWIDMAKQQKQQGAGLGVSPQGAQMNNIVAAQNAGGLLPSMGGAPQPGMAPPGAAGPGVPGTGMPS